MLKANLLSSANSEVNRNQLCFRRHSKPVSDKGSSKCFPRSPKLVPKESDHYSSQKLQPQKLIGAAKELINFMNEDYQKPKTPTKPPVNNNEPLGFSP